MIEFDTISLEPGKAYKVTPLADIKDFNRWHRTLINLDKFIKNGNPVDIISPHERLSPLELENYRHFFCSRAKEIGRNCIYFECPVSVEEQ